MIALAVLATVTVNASQVKDVELSYKDGFTSAVISIDGPVRFTHQTEEAKDGKPFRVIVDILSATHELGSKNFFELPNCLIKSIRTSQFAVTPEKVVRFVFDLNAEQVYRVDADKSSISIFFSDKSTHQFANWSSSQFLANKKKKSVKTASVQQPKQQKFSQKTKSVADLNKSMNDDRLSSLGNNNTSKKVISRKSISKPQPQVTKKVEYYGPEVDVDALAKEIEAEKKAQVLAKVEADKKAQVLAKVEADKKAKAIAKVEADKKAKAIAKVEADKKAKAIAKVEADKKAQVLAKVEADKKAKAIAKVEADKKAKAIAKVEADKKAKLLAKAEADKKAKAIAKVEADKKAKLLAKAEADKKAKLLAKAKADKKAKLLAKAKADKKAKALAQAKADKKAKALAQAKADKKAKILAKAEADKKKKSTSRFRRNPVSNKIKGTMVAQFPKRLVIKYKSKSYRDPFATLIDDSKTYNNPVEKKIPNVEGLKLVGIIQADQKSDNRALFEDNNGYGYILKTGDKVRKGYVLRVNSDKVYFQIFEYGWSRTVALNLEG